MKRKRLFWGALSEPVSYLVIWLLLLLMGLFCIGVSVYAFATGMMETYLSVAVLVIGLYLGVYFPVGALYSIKNCRHIHPRWPNQFVNPILWADEAVAERCWIWRNRNQTDDDD